MKARIISATVFALIFIPAIMIGGIFFLVVASFGTFMATYELLNVFGKENAFCNKLKFLVPFFSVALAIIFYLQGVYSSCYEITLQNYKLVLLSNLDINASLYVIYNLLILPIYILFVCVILIICTVSKEASAKDAHCAITALTYGGLLFSSAFALEYVNPIIVIEGESINILNFIFKHINGKLFLFVYGVIAMSDVFALLVGRRFGKRQLAPTISPKKSVEGALGGLIISSFLGVLFAYLLDILPITKDTKPGFIILCFAIIFFISALISILEQVGDLVASKFKRQYDVKDYGNIMPGHGGIMDRFDSTIIVGAMMYASFFIFKIIFIGVNI